MELWRPRPVCLPSFIHMQAFQALADPALAGGDRFRATTPTSWRMVEIGSGYFMYDVRFMGFTFLWVYLCCGRLVAYVHLLKQSNNNHMKTRVPDVWFLPPASCRLWSACSSSAVSQLQRSPAARWVAAPSSVCTV